MSRMSHGTISVAAATATSAVATRDAILADYRRKTPASAALHARARRSLAGGTTGNLRYFSPYPLYFASGEGSVMVDVDGNRYIDCFLCNGPLLLGHCPPAVVAAIAAHSATGSLVVNPLLAVEAAEELQRTVASAERVRFLNSGTEAVMSAVRVARAYTNRPNVIKFHGHYHGQDDQFLVGLGPTSDAFGAGVAPGTHSNTVLLPYADAEALDALLSRRDDIGAIVLDPAMHSGGLWGSDTAYLRTVRELATRHGVVLVFDEVITGFRMAAGGAQAVYGVTPDLSTFAKALAAGEKLAAVAGREDILCCLDPERPAGTPAVFQSGTGNDGTAALAAAAVALRTYRALEASGGYARLGALSSRLARGLCAAFTARGVACHINQLGPMLQIFLTGEPASFVRYASVPTGTLALFYLALINAGVLLSLPTSNHIYLSFAHTEADIDCVLAATRKVLDQHDFASLVDAESPLQGEKR